ncbi:MAG TPA: TlpA disulfide reductase family protein [Pyrinomonadaceae bacterium]|nr:TlpA disulfide reductase family protein [Pyrinomonadaceae bacterium]
MNFKILILTLILLFSGVVSTLARAGENEYTGQFETALAAHTEEFEKVIFKYASPENIKGEVSFKKDAHLSTARIYNPQTDKFSLSALLVEDAAGDEEDEEEDEAGKPPVIFIDLDGTGTYSENEKFALEQSEKDNPYLWHATVNLPVKNNFFTSCPVYVQYFKRVKIEKMTDEDRLIVQSTKVLARARVDVKGKKVLAQYAYSFEDKKITPQKGWLGVDSNEDGSVDMNKLSPEAAKATDETIVFRVGQMYLSTKKADVGKNQIVMREHEAKDYKRLELEMGKEFPDFGFTDFAGKKRRFSEFRGKYVLLDIWGFWCPPCRRERPYLREAARRYQARNLEIVGLNTDGDEMPLDTIKSTLDANEMRWTQAPLESVFDLLHKQLRIESFPTTFLIAPDGKILSMSRSTRGEPDLRGKDLLETLDEILPKK